MHQRIDIIGTGENIFLLLLCIFRKNSIQSREHDKKYCMHRKHMLPGSDVNVPDCASFRVSGRPPASAYTNDLEYFAIFYLKLRYFFYDILCHWDWVFHFFKSLTNMVRRQWVLCHLPHWVYATKPLVYGGLLPFSVSSVAVRHFCRQSLFATQLYSSKLWTILLFCGVARVASHPHDLVIYEFKVCK